jgi:hypothetical protein
MSLFEIQDTWKGVHVHILQFAYPFFWTGIGPDGVTFFSKDLWKKRKVKLSLDILHWGPQIQYIISNRL